MKIPFARLTVVIAAGALALVAQAGMTAMSAAVPSSVALQTTHLNSVSGASHAATSAKASAGTNSVKGGRNGQAATSVTNTTVVASGAKCDGVTNDTPAIQAAVDAAGKQPGGVVVIPAGICSLNGNVHLNTKNGVTVEGAGATKTFLVQHARSNIFQITSPGNTVEAMNLNTFVFNPGIIPIPKSPVPAVLFSNADNTTIENITAETGSGFGMRLTGPNPCYMFPITGSVVSNVTMVNHGTGGFAGVDIDCQNGAQLSNITIHGGILALFNDANTVLNGETYYGVNKCQPAWFVTGPATNILIENVVTYAGVGVIHGSRHGDATGIVVDNQTRGVGSSC